MTANLPANSQTAPQTDQVQLPLMLLLPIKDKAAAVKLNAVLQQSDQNLNQAIDAMGTVHFARFCILGIDTTQPMMAVVTSYDAPFDDYVRDIVNDLAVFFEPMFAFISDAPPLPLKDHIPEFTAYVKSHDHPPAGSFYSAYPTLSVQHIKALAGN